MYFTTARRDVWIIAIGTAISYAGDFLAATALTLTLQAHGASGTAIAALLLASTGPTVLLAPVAGRLVDRCSSRWLLTVVGAGQVVTCTALAWVGSSVAIVALMAVLASGLAVTGPTLTALVPQIVGREGVARAQSTVQAVRSLGILAGPALAGLLVGAYGPRVPLLLDAGSYLAVVAAGLALRTVRRGGPARPDPASGRVAGGLTLVRRDPLLTGYLVLLTAGVATVTADSVGGVFLIRGTLHASPTVYGLLEALWSVAVLGGAWLLGRRTPSDRGLLHLALLVMAVLGLVMLGMATVPAAGYLVPIYLIGGIANGGLNLTNGVLLGRRVAPAERGRVGAVFGGVANAGVLTGYLAGGLLLRVLSARGLFLACGVAALLVVGALAVPVLRAGRRAPAAVDIADAPAPQHT